MTVGTVAYMSPEQARGRLVDARSDLWALGVILYELATGIRPFDGPSAPLIFDAILNRAPVPIGERNPAVPAEIARIVDRLLDKDPDTRYQSAADVRADLKRAARTSDLNVAVASGSHADARVSSGTAAAAVAHARPRRSVAWAAVAVAVLAAGAAMWYTRRPGGTGNVAV